MPRKYLTIKDLIGKHAEIINDYYSFDFFIPMRYIELREPYLQKHGLIRNIDYVFHNRETGTGFLECRTPSIKQEIMKLFPHDMTNGMANRDNASLEPVQFINYYYFDHENNNCSINDFVIDITSEVEEARFNYKSWYIRSLEFKVIKRSINNIFEWIKNNIEATNFKYYDKKLKITLNRPDDIFLCRMRFNKSEWPEWPIKTNPNEKIIIPPHPADKKAALFRCFDGSFE